MLITGTFAILTAIHSRSLEGGMIVGNFTGKTEFITVSDLDDGQRIFIDCFIKSLTYKYLKFNVNSTFIFFMTNHLI